MSPIKAVSDIRRLPRLGKIRLGVKVEEPKKHPYPRATDYFVIPDDIKKYVGDKPKEFQIMFPVEDAEVFAPQFLKCYSFTQGLVCRGDGIRATRKVDVETGDIANHTTEQRVFKEMTCDLDTCPQAIGDPEMNIRPQCRRVMNLLFVLPNVPGLGVWQLDTSSFFSIVKNPDFSRGFRYLQTLVVQMKKCTSLYTTLSHHLLFTHQLFSQNTLVPRDVLPKTSSSTSGIPPPYCPIYLYESGSLKGEAKVLALNGQILV